MHDHKGIFCTVLLYLFGTTLPRMAYSFLFDHKSATFSWKLAFYAAFTASWHDNLLAGNTRICEGSASNFWLDEAKRDLPMKVCPYANFQAGISGLWSRTLLLVFLLRTGRKKRGCIVFLPFRYFESFLEGTSLRNMHARMWAVCHFFSRRAQELICANRWVLWHNSQIGCSLVFHPSHLFSFFVALSRCSGETYSINCMPERVFSQMFCPSQ